MFFQSKDKSVSVHQLGELLGKINLIDVREPYEFQYGHLPTAVNIPLNTLLSQPNKYLDINKEYHVICQSGSRSAMTCSILKQNGFKVINVSGGTGSYTGRLEK